MSYSYMLKRYNLGEKSQPVVTKPPPPPPPQVTKPVVPVIPVIPSKLDIMYITDSNKITISQTLFDSIFPNCNIEQLTMQHHQTYEKI